MSKANPSRSARRNWDRLPAAGFVVMATMFVAGFGAVVLIDARSDTSTTEDDGAADVATELDPELDGASTSTTDAEAALDLAIPDFSALPQGDEEDRMAIRIETPDPAPADDDANSGGSDNEATASGNATGASATIRTDGRLYFEGAFRSTAEAERYVTRAAEVFGAEAIVANYSIDSNAPVPQAGDVGLDKPVLFERGSAEIHPDYIPFLEACGDVLKLNPDITMSISAFTDASGPEELNLELSQRRAQAIVEFYRDLDVADEQLLGTGFGEVDAFGDNDTTTGQRENRRAMLQLLDVMSED